MANPNGRKGTQWEVDVMKRIRTISGAICERLAKSGSADEGDLVAIIAGKTYILECKNHKSLSLPEFWRQAQTEAKNYAKARGITAVPPAYVIAKRRNAGVDQGWVIQDLAQWIEEKQG